MNGLRQGWLVALRELRERSRSRAFRAGIAVTLIVVVAMVALPAMVDPGAVTTDIGFAGTVPAELPAVVVAQGDAVDVTVRVHRYGHATNAAEAVRDADIDVLVVDGRRLAWRREPDERLRAMVTGAIQLVAVQERARAAGIDPEELLALVAPVPIENEVLGTASGRGTDDEAAAAVMSILLLLAIVTYGNMVLTGVVEEKANRVVEVLLARMPAGTLLAGKVAGIGLLGLGQFVVTALAAFVATLVVDAVELPAVSGPVLAWVVVWFVLGYAMYAMAYGALGSLASRSEDASSVAGPVSYALLAAYWASYIAVAGDPESVWSQLASLFPATAPFAMPARIALGAAAWWEPALAVCITLGAVAGLVLVAGRLYTGAILHTGSTLHVRDAWRGAAHVAPEPSGSRRAGFALGGRHRSSRSPKRLASE